MVKIVNFMFYFYLNLNKKFKRNLIIPFSHCGGTGNFYNRPSPQSPDLICRLYVILGKDDTKIGRDSKIVIMVEL